MWSSSIYRTRLKMLNSTKQTRNLKTLILRMQVINEEILIIELKPLILQCRLAIEQHL